MKISWYIIYTYAFSKQPTFRFMEYTPSKVLRINATILIDFVFFLLFNGKLVKLQHFPRFSTCISSVVFWCVDKKTSTIFIYFAAHIALWCSHFCELIFGVSHENAFTLHMNIDCCIKFRIEFAILFR